METIFYQSKAMMGKRLKKIYKQEAESLRLLENQKIELAKAIEENVKLIRDELEEESPPEIKIRQEIEDLKEKVELLNTQLTKVTIRTNFNWKKG